MGSINMLGSYNPSRQINYEATKSVDENANRSVAKRIPEKKPLIEPFKIAMTCVYMFAAANVFLPYEGVTTARITAITGLAVSLLAGLIIASAEDNKETQLDNDQSESPSINTGIKKIANQAENAIPNIEKKFKFSNA